MDKCNIMSPGLYLMDCMEAMKQFPDKFFDIAIVDPPYGDASRTDTGGGTLYEKRSYNRFGQRFERYITEIQGGTKGLIVPAETGRRNTAKKSWHGTQPRGRNTLKSYAVSHAIRSSGAETILICRRRGASWCGTS